MAHMAGLLQALSSFFQLSAVQEMHPMMPLQPSPVSLNSFPNYCHWTLSHLQSLLWIMISPALWPSARPSSDTSHACKRLQPIFSHVEEGGHCVFSMLQVSFVSPLVISIRNWEKQMPFHFLYINSILNQYKPSSSYQPLPNQRGICSSSHSR